MSGQVKSIGTTCAVGLGSREWKTARAGGAIIYIYKKVLSEQKV